MQLFKCLFVAVEKNRVELMLGILVYSYGIGNRAIITGK